MATPVDEVIGGVVETLYKAEAATWNIQDKAVLLAAVQAALTPVKANLPQETEAQRAGKDKSK